MPLVADVTPTEFRDQPTFANTVYSALCGLGLPGRAAELLTAHMALSTGWGRGALGYNFTGLKAGDRSACYGGAPASGNYTCLCTFERTKSGAYAAGCSDCPPKEDKPRCKYPFRAFTSLREGLTATVKTLQNSRHAEAYALLLDGDVEYFRALYRSGWYTEKPELVYSGGLARLRDVRKYLGQGAPPLVAGFSLAPVAVGAVGWFIFRWWMRRKRV